MRDLLDSSSGSQVDDPCSCGLSQHALVMMKAASQCFHGRSGHAFACMSVDGTSWRWTLLVYMGSKDFVWTRVTIFSCEVYHFPRIFAAHSLHAHANCYSCVPCPNAALIVMTHIQEHPLITMNIQNASELNFLLQHSINQRWSLLGQYCLRDSFA